MKTQARVALALILAVAAAGCSLVYRDGRYGGNNWDGGYDAGPVPDAPVVDGGTDSGVVVDGGADGGAADAGPPDSGTVDAGLPDAGPVDGGTEDGA